MMTEPLQLVYATRRSALALAQCRAFVKLFVDAHAARGVSIAPREEQIVTSGDRIQDRPLSEVGGKGLFVKEIEEALLDRRAHFAVHSIKDVPGLLPPGLALVCIPQREDPRDVLVAPKHGTLADLPQGARVGTSSLRRQVALLAHRPDLQIVPLRGNVDTRLRKVDEGNATPSCWPRAGLVRLGLQARATDVLEPDVSLPAVGQGALGIECRDDDAHTRDLLAPLQHEASGRAVAAERGVMVALEGDCKTPLAAYAIADGDQMILRAFVANPDGTRLHRAERRISWPKTDAAAHAVGLDLGAELHAARA